MGKNQRLHGLVVPVLTPLVDDTTVDETVLRTLLTRCRDGGAHGLFIGSTAGLGPLLTDRAAARFFEVARDDIQDELPLLAGVIEASTPAPYNVFGSSMRCGISISLLHRRFPWPFASTRNL